MQQAFKHHVLASKVDEAVLGTYFLNWFCSCVHVDDFSLTDPVDPEWERHIPDRVTCWHESFHAVQNCASGFGAASALWSFLRVSQTALHLVDVRDPNILVEIPLRNRARMEVSSDLRHKYNDICECYTTWTEALHSLHTIDSDSGLGTAEVLEGAAALLDVLNERYYLRMNGMELDGGNSVLEMAPIIKRMRSFDNVYRAAFDYFLTMLGDALDSMNALQVCSLFFFATDLALHIPPPFHESDTSVYHAPGKRFALLTRQIKLRITQVPIIPQSPIYPIVRKEKDGMIHAFHGYIENVAMLARQHSAFGKEYVPTDQGFPHCPSSVLDFADLVLHDLKYVGVNETSDRWLSAIALYYSGVPESGFQCPHHGWMRNYWTTRRKTPHLFWGFSNIRMSINQFGNPFVSKSLDSHDSSISFSVTGEYDRDIRSRANGDIEKAREIAMREIALPLRTIIFVDCVLDAIINTGEIRCPVVEYEVLGCEHRSTDCSTNITANDTLHRNCPMRSIMNQIVAA